MVSVFSKSKLSSRSDVNIDLAMTFLERVNFVRMMTTAEDDLLYTISGPNHLGRNSNMPF